MKRKEKHGLELVLDLRNIIFYRELYNLRDRDIWRWKAASRWNILGVRVTASLANRIKRAVERRL